MTPEDIALMKAAVAAWRANPNRADAERLLAIARDFGRLAERLEALLDDDDAATVRRLVGEQPEARA